MKVFRTQDETYILLFDKVLKINKYIDDESLSKFEKNSLLLVPKSSQWIPKEEFEYDKSQIIEF